MGLARKRSLDGSYPDMHREDEVTMPEPYIPTEEDLARLPAPWNTVATGTLKLDPEERLSASEVLAILEQPDSEAAEADGQDSLSDKSSEPEKDGSASSSAETATMVKPSVRDASDHLLMRHPIARYCAELPVTG
ncbi:hypothetical protein WJX73_009642 [Symbiochloris irregularis]|uniref:Uncharacterized protein n=1 Tax=Symbiochloris irregularis TaxID=706552 RepID=A0AAW1NT00_9CHLO